MSIYNDILKKVSKNEPIIAGLLDPDSEDIKKIKDKVGIFNKSRIDYIFIGGSTTGRNEFSTFVKSVKKISKKPVVIFPGSANQISPHADALLFLSLVSGQNPQYLIGEHIRAAPLLKKMNIEIIPTGYILIDGGNTTTVEFVSGTKPVPQDKPELARNIAYAAQLLGMKLVYLDCGSGAKKSAANHFIKTVKEFIDIPLIVGGGIKTQDEIEEKQSAGADIIVIGSALENNPQLLIKDSR